MARKQITTDLTKLLFSFMNQPDPMLSMLEWLCSQMMEADIWKIAIHSFQEKERNILMQKSIEEYTEDLFNCRFADDSFDPEGQENHLKESWELFDHYSWKEIFPVWFRYLREECPTASDVINFVNLYVYYDAGSKPVANPIKFISYLYYKVNMGIYWDEAGDLFDGLAINILSHSGYLNLQQDPYYNPLKDEHVLRAISEWENKK